MVSELWLNKQIKYILPLLQIVLLLASGFMFGNKYYILSIIFSLPGALIAWLIFKTGTSTDKIIISFLDALNNNDTAIQYSVKNSSKSMKAIYAGLNKLNQHFQEIKVQNEVNEKYYKALIHHSATGLLVLCNNKVEVINKMACKYAGISHESINTDLLRIKNPLFYEAICSLKPGEDVTYKQIIGNEISILLFRSSIMHKNEQTVKLISIQDIRHELELKELDSYKKLIRVMTHEIMNLMSPLTSVSKSLHNMYYNNERPIELNQINEEIFNTTINSLEVIDGQCNGILNFLGNFKKISRIPSPVIKPFSSNDWVEQLKIVFGEQLQQKDIKLEINLDKRLDFIKADKNLINQVIINLINNATEAFNDNQSDRYIKINIESVINGIRISISNNGVPINKDVQEKLFIPFFTTKKYGSGIGLSICQEIVKMHKGSLTFHSTKSETSFIIEI